MVAKKHQNPSGGLNEAGRKHFKRTEGSNLKRPQRTGSDGRRVSFAARFGGMAGPLKDSKGRPIMNSFDAYRDMHNSEHCELVENKVLKFTKVKDKSLEKHLKVVTKKVGAKLEKISGGFAVSDTDMRGFTAVVDYIFDKSIKKNMLDGGGMSDVTMSNESNNQMWEDAIEENIERGIMRKMRKGRVAKGMPR